jgi:ribosomal protein S18 acetylase RimI-like enzyme
LNKIEVGIQMNHTEFKIVPASTADIEELSTFFSTSQLSNRHLDWQKTITWLGSQPFLKCYFKDDLISVLVCPVTGQDFIWIRSFNCTNQLSAESSFQQLLDTAISILDGTGIHKLYTISLSPWYEELINNCGFVTVDKIVTLRKEKSSIIPFEHPLIIQIRDFLPSDIDQAFAVDHQAFPPLWQISKEDFTQALSISKNKSVALNLSGEIIGYQISSNIFDSGHIARIAVVPEYQKQHIGSALLENLFRRFIAIGVREITVNTSSDNLPAINLYLRHGFSYTQNNYPIYSKIINQL